MFLRFTILYFSFFEWLGDGHCDSPNFAQFCCGSLWFRFEDTVKVTRLRIKMEGSVFKCMFGYRKDKMSKLHSCTPEFVGEVVGYKHEVNKILWPGMSCW